MCSVRFQEKNIYVMISIRQAGCTKIFYILINLQFRRHPTAEKVVSNGALSASQNVYSSNDVDKKCTDCASPVSPCEYTYIKKRAESNKRFSDSVISAYSIRCQQRTSKKADALRTGSLFITESAHTQHSRIPVRILSRLEKNLHYDIRRGIKDGIQGHDRLTAF